jgi:hypothetical protein
VDGLSIFVCLGVLKRHRFVAERAQIFVSHNDRPTVNNLPDPQSFEKKILRWKRDWNERPPFIHAWAIGG